MTHIDYDSIDRNGVLRSQRGLPDSIREIVLEDDKLTLSLNGKRLSFLPVITKDEPDKAVSDFAAALLFSGRYKDESGGLVSIKDSIFSIGGQVRKFFLYLPEFRDECDSVDLAIFGDSLGVESTVAYRFENHFVSFFAYDTVSRQPKGLLLKLERIAESD